MGRFKYFRRRNFKVKLIMTDRERIGQRIEEIRTKKAMTQEQLADLCGLKQHHISRIESGKYSTGIDILGKIADALGCRIDLIE